MSVYNPFGVVLFPSMSWKDRKEAMLRILVSRRASRTETQTAWQKRVSAKAASTRKKGKEWSLDRAKRVVEMREQGKTLAQIGGELGISHERVRQIINKHRRRGWG